MKEAEKGIYKAKANVIKALGHPTRLWITERLANGEQCVCKLVDAMDVDFSTISKHLTILKQAGVIEDEKRGKQVFYSLKAPCVLNFISCIETVIKNQVKEQAALVK